MEGEGAKTTRRTFLDLALGGGFTALSAAVLYPVASYLIPPERGDPGARTITLDPTDPDLVDPETRVFVFGNKPGILVRGPGGEWKAFSAICTHLSCTVRYKADTRQIWCPCHNGFFDLNGRNLPGTPPPRPLDEFEVFEREDGSVVVRREASS
jgi:Rieske Fe-S protein